jgi:hypothetical protein
MPLVAYSSEAILWLGTSNTPIPSESGGTPSPRRSRIPYRVLYAFDPRRVAILLIGGDKTGNDRWYVEFVPQADRLYDEHLAWLGTEEPPNG